MELSFYVLFWQSFPFPADSGPSERNWTPPEGFQHPPPSPTPALHPCFPDAQNGEKTHRTLLQEGGSLQE